MTPWGDSDAESLIQLARAEYDDKRFEEIAVRIQSQWEMLVETWPSTVLEELGIEFQQSYVVRLTQYGVGGSYDLPNIITINILTRDIDNISAIIMHEMVHLAIELLIRKYNISHWQKERLVDLVCVKLIPEKARKQKLPESEIRVVDMAFSNFYGPIEGIIKNIPVSAPSS